jgi:hypothetical protein
MRKALNGIVLVIDFDGTINAADKPFPDPGSEKEGAKTFINKLWSEGFFIIVWSCRNGIAKLTGEQWMMDHGIQYDKFNEPRPSELLQFNGEDTRKVWGTVYIDDRNLEWKVNGMPEWPKIYDMCQKLKKENCIPDHQLKVA